MEYKTSKETSSENNNFQDDMVKRHLALIMKEMMEYRCQEL